MNSIPRSIMKVDDIRSALSETLSPHHQEASYQFERPRNSSSSRNPVLKHSGYNIQILQSTPDKCKAAVKLEESTELSNLVKVQFQSDISLEQFKFKSTEWQQGHIRLFFHHGVPSLLYIGEIELRGGGPQFSRDKTCPECGENPWECICGHSCPCNRCWSHCTSSESHVCHVCSINPRTPARCPRYYRCKACNSTEKCDKCCGCVEQAQEQNTLSIVSHEDEWRTLIVQQALKTIQQQHAVLIICGDIERVEELILQLREHRPSSKIFSYTGNAAESFKVTELKEGEILVATNIVGRGIDIGTTEKVECHGGLHVIITFLPVSNRVNLQNIGRTRRSRNERSTHLIVHDPHSRKSRKTSC